MRVFVKTYLYKVLEKDFSASQRINKEADAIYDFYGRDKVPMRPVTLFRKDGEFVHVVLIEFYSSEEEYKKLIEKVNKDSRIDALWNAFIALVVGEKVEVEDFKTID